MRTVEIKVFLTICAWRWEGSRVGSGCGSGSVLVTNGSGSGRPKNIRIRMWIRIRHTAEMSEGKNKKNKRLLCKITEKRKIKRDAHPHHCKQHSRRCKNRSPGGLYSWNRGQPSTREAGRDCTAVCSSSRTQTGCISGSLAETVQGNTWKFSFKRTGGHSWINLFKRSTILRVHQYFLHMMSWNDGFLRISSDYAILKI